METFSLWQHCSVGRGHIIILAIEARQFFDLGCRVVPDCAIGFILFGALSQVDSLAFVFYGLLSESILFSRFCNKAALMPE